MRKTKIRPTRNKKREELKKSLGLTQEEMAMYLGITMSQWSMFKSHKRDLPTDAMLKLSSLLQSVQKEKGVSKATRQFLMEEELTAKKELELDELKTRMRLLRIKKKIAIMENNRAEAFAALQTVGQLEKQQTPDEGLISIIRKRALKTLKKYSKHHLEQLKSKQQSLELLQSELQKRLQKGGGETQFEEKEMEYN